IDGFEEVLTASVERRLRADVPVVSYLSGGVDSSIVAALASKRLGGYLPTFTIQMADPHLDETNKASMVSKHIGSNPLVMRFGADEMLKVYPRLVEAAESPVIDTSCGALLLLAQQVHSRGYKVALTGEGSDEWMPGYPWYRTHKLLSFLYVIPGVPLSFAGRRRYLGDLGTPQAHLDSIVRARKAVIDHNAWLDFYGMMT